MTSRRTFVRTFAFAAAAALLTGAASGCNYFILAGYLISGPPSVEPHYETITKKSLTDKDVVVAVVCFVPKEVSWAHVEKIDQEVAKYVSHRFAQNHITVIQPGVINDWMDKHPDWDRPDEIAKGVNANHVVYIDMHHYSIFEPGSANMYRGNAEAVVSVYKLDEDGYGEQIYSKDLTSKYPAMGGRLTSEVSENTFKRLYLSRLSDEIGQLFYPHYNGDDFTHAY